MTSVRTVRVQPLASVLPESKTGTVAFTPRHMGTAEALGSMIPQPPGQSDSKADKDLTHREKFHTGWRLYFYSPEDESKYASLSQSKNRYFLGVACFNLVWVCLAAFFIRGAHNWLGHESIAARLAGWCHLSQLLNIAVCAVLIYKRWVDIEWAIIVAAIISVFLSYPMDVFRATLMSKSSMKFYAELISDCTAIICQCDWLPLLLSFGAMVMVHLFFEIRTRKSWVLPVMIVVLQECMNYFVKNEKGQFMYLETDTTGISVLLILTSYFCWRGRYYVELQSRFSFLDQEALIQKILLQREALQKRNRALKQLEEYRLFLSNPHGAMPSVTVEEAESRAGEGKGIPKPAMIRLTTRSNLPLPMPIQPSLATLTVDNSHQEPNPFVWAVLNGRKTNLDFVNTIARSIRRPDYGLKAYCEDCIKAFPELELYFLQTQRKASNLGNEVCAPMAVGHVKTISSGLGRSQEDEYLRTLGALFSVYWIVRLDLDGKYGFCFGVNERWENINVEQPNSKLGETETFDFSDVPDGQKRYTFFSTMDWSNFTEVVQSSGCNTIERLSAMLCLTSFHDIFKDHRLLPKVQAVHAPYKGYQAGEIIGDHDLALSYVLEHFPQLVPSFHALPPESQKAVLFAQGKMQFNHGWFVQAEGPPGAMLRNLKKILIGAKPGDLSFYFLHWLTDLAGAEGTPRGGAEKFVLKFPHAVLKAFLWSIPYLKRLEHMTETAVVESYLVARWQQTFPGRPSPDGPMAIAMMRLAIMAQNGAKEAIEAFNEMPITSQTFLANEMAKTGIEGQTFGRSPVAGGPAFLVYYGPALLQRNIGEREKMKQALFVLEAVYRAGRSLWPESSRQENLTVTLQIGQLKSREVEHVFDGDPDSKGKTVWAMQVTSENEGCVDLCTASTLNMFADKGIRHRCLDLSSSVSLDPLD